MLKQLQDDRGLSFTVPQQCNLATLLQNGQNPIEISPLFHILGHWEASLAAKSWRQNGMAGASLKAYILIVVDA